MKDLYKSWVFLFLFCFALTSVFSCSKYKEPAPLRNGIFLEYISDKGNPKYTYKVESLGDKGFKLVETEAWSALRGSVTEFLIDNYGKVYKSSGDGSYIGSFSPIWIPVNKMEIGDVFDEDHHVMRRMSWKTWDVLVVENTAGASIGKVEDYYDVTTGFKVGTYVNAGGEIEIILIQTNVPGLINE